MDPTNRTFVCSVLFLDIVEYSRRSVAEQMALKQRFNALLGKALQRVAVDDRIVLDTGDGAAVSFLGNPEDTLFVATALRDAVAGDAPDHPARLSLRVGINLGPVRLIQDLNGQPNIIGDGINVAQRIMSFAAAGQILVSRSYYEVVSRLDPQFAQLFHYEGARTDKHVREHEVYGVGMGVPRWGALGSEPAAPHGRRISRRLQVALPVTMAVILSAGIAARLQRPGESDRSPHAIAAEKRLPFVVAARADTGSTVLRGADGEGAIALPPFTPTVAMPSDRRTSAPSPVATMTHGKAPYTKVAGDKPAGIDTSDQRDRPASAEPLDKPDRPVSPDPALATLLVVPWGEVVVNGRSRGVTPPLRQLDLPPGRHEIEIRNSTFPPHSQTVTVRAGQRITIRHRFDRS